MERLPLSLLNTCLSLEAEAGDFTEELAAVLVDFFLAHLLLLAAYPKPLLSVLVAHLL
jgi:hypothetical protein